MAQTAPKAKVEKAVQEVERQVLAPWRHHPFVSLGVADLENEPIRTTLTYQHLSDEIIPGISNAST